MRQALGLGLRGGPAAPDKIGGVERAPPNAPRPQADRRARRFIRDGEVPVVVLNTHRDGEAPGVNRLAAAEASLMAERTLRERAERSLADAQGAVLQLQTKLRHDDLAHQEALASERAAREAAEAARARAEQAQEAAEQALAQAEKAQSQTDKALARSEQALQAARHALADAERARETLQAQLAEHRSRLSRPAKAPRETETEAESAPRPAPTVKRTRRAAAEPKQREPQPVKWWLPSYRTKLQKG